MMEYVYITTLAALIYKDQFFIPTNFFFFCARILKFPLMIFKKAEGNPRFPAVRAGRVPWAGHRHNRPSMCACHHLSVIAFYCVMHLMVQFIRLQQDFIRDAPLLPYHTSRCQHLSGAQSHVLSRTADESGL
jgi:hypothetical protein